MVELPDELSLIDPGLKEAIEFELSVVLDIINKSLKQPLKLTFSSSGGVRSKIDPCLDGYEMFIPTRFITCLALTLRLLCATRKKVGERMFIATHQHDGEALARDEKRDPVAYKKFRSEPLEPKYLALVGALGDPAELNLLKWWCEEFHLEPSNEFDEFRNGLRYGLLFCILHEAAHVLLDHFNARNLVRGGLIVDLSENEAVAGFELEADRFAFENLLYYALFMADLSDPGPDVYSLINSRSWELYRLVYGVYSTLSLFDVSKWVSGDYAEEIYFHPGDRVYLNLILENKSFELIGGEALFIRFPGAFEPRPRAFFPQLEDVEVPKNFLSFGYRTLLEWNGDVDDFLFHCYQSYTLPPYPIPFAMSRSYSTALEQEEKMLSLLNRVRQLTNHEHSVVLSPRILPAYYINAVPTPS